MIDQVINLASNSIKSIGFDATNVYLSNVQFGTIDGLRDKCINSTRGSSRKIPLDKIHKLTHTAGEEAISIYFFGDSGKKKSFYLEGFNPEIAEQFIRSLAQQAGLNDFRGSESKKRDFTKQYVTIAGLLVFIPAIAWIASGPRTGRRSNLVKLAQDIGPVGIIIIGAVILLVVLFQMYRISRQPANQTVFSKN